MLPLDEHLDENLGSLMIVAGVGPFANIYHVPHGLVVKPLISVLVVVGAVAPTAPTISVFMV